MTEPEPSVTPCTDGHDRCEGGSLHIRTRDAKGCAQFQDGSWITKDRGVCPGPHPSPVEYGIGGLTRDWLEASFAANRLR